MVRGTRVAVGVLSIGLSLIHNRMLKQTQKQLELESHRLTHPRPSSYKPRVAVLVPARNEEKYVADCVNTLKNQQYPQLEIVVINDNSTDETPTVLNQLADQLQGQLKIVNCTPPAEGWVGKNNALWQGYQVIGKDVEWILFLDADTTLTNTSSLSLVLDYAQEADLDLVSLIPGGEIKDFWHRLLAPEIIKFYTLAISNPTHRPAKGSVEEAIANGAFILVRRAAYDQTGGHCAVRNSAIEDVAIARLFRTNGFKTERLWGVELSAMVPFEPGLKDLWESIAKNVFLAADKNWLSLVYTILYEWLYSMAPLFVVMSNLLALIKGKRLAKSNIWEAFCNMIAVGLAVQFQGNTNRQFGVPRRYALLYPVSVILTTLLALYSAFRVSLKGSVSWKGREVKVS